jgi:uncharacterized membrane protein
MPDGALHAHTRRRESFALETSMAKSATFGVLHLGIAFSVSCLLTGSVAIAGAITLVEPVVNTVAHCVFDRWWASRHAGALAGPAP